MRKKFEPVGGKNDAYLVGKSVLPDKLPESIDGYWAARKKNPRNGKFAEKSTLACQNLRIEAYCQGLVGVQVAKESLNATREIIDRREGSPKKT